jgi:hypothetical protein
MFTRGTRFWPTAIYVTIYIHIYIYIIIYLYIYIYISIYDYDGKSLTNRSFSMSNYPRVKLGKTEICNMTFFPFGIAIVWKDTPIWRKKDNAVRQNSCTNTSCSGQKRHWFWRHYGCIMDITVAYPLYDTATPKKKRCFLRPGPFNWLTWTWTWCWWPGPAAKFAPKFPGSHQDDRKKPWFMLYIPGKRIYFGG